MRKHQMKGGSVKKNLETSEVENQHIFRCFVNIMNFNGKYEKIGPLDFKSIDLEAQMELDAVLGR